MYICIYTFIHMCISYNYHIIYSSSNRTFGHRKNHVCGDGFAGKLRRGHQQPLILSTSGCSIQQAVNWANGRDQLSWKKLYPPVPCNQTWLAGRFELKEGWMEKNGKNYDNVAFIAMLIIGGCLFLECELAARWERSHWKSSPCCGSLLLQLASLKLSPHLWPLRLMNPWQSAIVYDSGSHIGNLYV